mmetsp:Transcript_19935/g.57266  ORF Transcript_19935/g.57266 Transcript_19935/m.57266 type:complete len:441 (-) Transcript_19935:380-1702(-)
MSHRCPRLARRIKCGRNFRSGSFPAIAVRRAKDLQLGPTVQFGQIGRDSSTSRRFTLPGLVTTLFPLLPVQKFERYRLVEYFALNLWHAEVSDNLREDRAILIKSHFALLLNRFFLLNTIKGNNHILIVIYHILHLPLLFGCPGLGHCSFLLQLFVSLLTGQMVLQCPFGISRSRLLALASGFGRVADLLCQLCQVDGLVIDDDASDGDRTKGCASVPDLVRVVIDVGRFVLGHARRRQTPSAPTGPAIFRGGHHSVKRDLLILPGPSSVDHIVRQALSLRIRFIFVGGGFVSIGRVLALLGAATGVTALLGRIDFHRREGPGRTHRRAIDGDIKFHGLLRQRLEATELPSVTFLLLLLTMGLGKTAGYTSWFGLGFASERSAHTLGLVFIPVVVVVGATAFFGAMVVHMAVVMTVPTTGTDVVMLPSTAGAAKDKVGLA